MGSMGVQVLQDLGILSPKSWSLFVNRCVNFDVWWFFCHTVQAHRPAGLMKTANQKNHDRLNYLPSLVQTPEHVSAAGAAVLAFRIEDYFCDPPLPLRSRKFPFRSRSDAAFIPAMLHSPNIVVSLQSICRMHSRTFSAHVIAYYALPLSMKRLCWKTRFGG